MSKYNVTMSQEKGTEVEPQCAVISGAVRRSDYPAYVRLDVHKETIAVSVARAGREAPMHWGEIANEAAAVSGLVSRLSELFGGERLLFCYEAGPCGYVLYRQLVSLGQSCEVVAPSLMLRAPGERIKTDRRDAAKLSVQSRSGVLTGAAVCASGRLEGAKPVVRALPALATGRQNHETNHRGDCPGTGRVYLAHRLSGNACTDPGHCLSTCPPTVNKA